VRARVLRLLVLSIALTAAAYLGVLLPGPTPRWTPWLLALGSNGVIMSLMALGAIRRDVLPRSLAWTFVGIFLVCAGAFVVALALPAHEGAGGPLLLGLPLRTAIVLYGVGVVPIAVLPLAYALTFDSSTLSEEDLARVRALAAAVRAASPDRLP
jgi:hypothetical protein